MDRKIEMILGTVWIVVVLCAAVIVLGNLSDSHPTPQVPPSRPPASTGLSDGFPACPFEDGSPDGQPCVWTDPGNGNMYYVDSGEYRN